MLGGARNGAGWLCLIALLLLPAGAGAEATRSRPVASVGIDELSGDVRIRYRDGGTVTAAKSAGQMSLGQLARADDRQTVGWVGNYDSCCQSYPIARQLVVWRRGRIIRRIDAGAMIWNWRFFAGGKRVGLADGPTHGTDVPYSYKLYDVASGRLLGEIDGDRRDAPGWARLLAPATTR